MATPRFPIHSLFMALALLGSNAVLAQSRAVQALNFEGGMAASEVDTADSTSNGTVGVNLGGTVPIGNYLGLSVSGSYSDSSVRTRKMLVDAGAPTSGARSSCGFESTDGDVALFARRPSLGRIGVRYGVGRIASDCGDNSVFVVNGEEKLSTTNYSVDAEVYWRDFTLAASRTTTDLDDGPKLETTSWTASWYALDSLRVAVSGNDLYDQDTYGISLEHQPDFLGDALGVSVGYASTDQSPRMRTISLGITYYFGTLADLKTRDRQYR